jgi:hypothetical protein
MAVSGGVGSEPFALRFEAYAFAGLLLGVKLQIPPDILSS